LHKEFPKSFSTYINKGKASKVFGSDLTSVC
jgi:hypothetical protein